MGFSVLRIEGHSPLYARASQLNSAFLLAFVTTPINSAHSMRLCMQAMCFLHMRMTNDKVKVVNNASGKCLAASSPQTGM